MVDIIAQLLGLHSLTDHGVERLVLNSDYSPYDSRRPVSSDGYLNQIQHGSHHRTFHQSIVRTRLGRLFISYRQLTFW